MRRLVPFVLLFASVATTAAAQSLGEVAERTKKERKGKEAKVYTNDDLGAEHSTAAPPAAGSAAAGVLGGTVGAVQIAGLGDSMLPR